MEEIKSIEHAVEHDINHIKESIKEDLTKKYKEMGYKKFSTLGVNTSSQNKTESLKDVFTKEDIQKWFTNPEQYSKELRDVSRYLYISKGVYYTSINFYTNLLTLDFTLLPRFLDFDEKNKDSILKSKQKNKDYCDDILQKPIVRNIIKAVLKDGAYFGYERSSQSSFYIQRLPNDYCRDGAIVDGVISIEFNFDYFKRKEDKLPMYDAEFATKYNAYLKDNNLKWQQLDHLKTICIPMESEDFNFPSLSGIMDNLLDLDDYYKYMKQSIELDVARILIQKPPMNKETGEMLVDPDDVWFFQSAIADVLDERFKIVSTPFEVDSINFTQSKNGDSGFLGVDKMKDNIWNGVGIAKPVFGETDSATGLRLNHEVNVSYVFAILEKIEMWINQRLKRIGTKKFGFKVKFLPITNINKKESFEMFNKLLAIGGSLYMAIIATGVSPDDYVSLLQLENLEGIKEHLIIPESMYTQTGENEGGAPKKDDGDIGDAGEKTRDSDGNDR